MGWSRNDSRQRTLDLAPPAPREPTREDLLAAYQACVLDKDRLPFDLALSMPAIATTLRTVAKAILRRRGA